MKSQIVQPKNSLYHIETQIDYCITKKPIKTKNFIFTKNWSVKLQKNIKYSKIHSENRKYQISHDHNFIPKLKSKQILREPKFFFSVQRKKLKKQLSQPSFQTVRCNNPEMKGSKTKTVYTKFFNSRKESSQSIKIVQKNPQTPNKSQNDKLFTYPSQAFTVKEQYERKPLVRNFSHNPQTQNIKSVKTIKRPNLNENISFLIRKKRQMRNKTTLNKINETRHKMSQIYPNFMKIKLDQ